MTYKGIGLVGKMHSGKGTVARSLVERHGFVEMAFADPLKDDSIEMLNLWISRHNQRLRAMGVTEKLLPVSREWADRNKGLMRTFWQWLGAEWGREYVGPDSIWVDVLCSEASDLIDGAGLKVVVSDVRYPNEADRLREMGFLIVRVDRPEDARLASVAATGQQGITGHSSEALLDQIRVDAVIKNDHLPYLESNIDFVLGMFDWMEAA